MSVKMIALAMAGALSLAACASTQPRIVRVPVSVSCVKEETPAEPPKVAGLLTGNAERDVGILGASAIRLRSWGHELEAMLEACRG